MSHPTQPSLPADRPGSDRKRKAEDEGEYEGMRLRSRAPPPSALAPGSDADSGPLSAKRGDGGRSWGKEGEEVLRAQQASAQKTHPSSSPGVGAMPRQSGYWATVTQERDKIGQEEARQTQATGALNQRQVPNPSLSRGILGTQPGFGPHEATAGVGYGKRKRNESDDAEKHGFLERSKRTQTQATHAQEVTAVRPNIREVLLEAMHATSSTLPELDAKVPTFTHIRGLQFGQLLPYGEIQGFAELPPLIQIHDLYSISATQPQPEHSWIQQNWRIIQTLNGVKAPISQHKYRYDGMSMCGTERKGLTFSAIKTFRKLGEDLWQSWEARLMKETLNLFQKEMDYIVLLLLVHGHRDDRRPWERRVRILFTRLDAALRLQNMSA